MVLRGWACNEGIPRLYKASEKSLKRVHVHWSPVSRFIHVFQSNGWYPVISTYMGIFAPLHTRASRGLRDARSCSRTSKKKLNRLLLSL